MNDLEQARNEMEQKRLTMNGLRETYNAQRRWLGDLNKAVSRCTDLRERMYVRMQRREVMSRLNRVRAALIRTMDSCLMLVRMVEQMQADQRQEREVPSGWAFL